MHDRAAILQAIQTFASLAKQSGVSEAELTAAIQPETIPATIFRADATPLESVASYLAASGRSPKEIAKALGRNKAYIDSVLARGTRHAEPTPTPYHVPLAMLADGAVGERVAAFLHASGLTTAQVAALMHKDTSTVHTWLRRAEARR